MSNKELVIKLREASKFIPDTIPQDIVYGDMPGDQIKIDESHLLKSKVIFEALVKEMINLVEHENSDKLVLCVCGGSGVGKSEIASLLSSFFEMGGIGSYTLSGDNYPHRIPKYNDAERLSIYRRNGLQALLTEEAYNSENAAILKQLQMQNQDADLSLRQSYPWLATYIKSGKEALQNYLGTDKEIDFREIERVVQQFKDRSDKIWLKRMGRELTDIWYDQIDFSSVNVLIIEWTHGNSNYYQGVDIPILLHSTPKETAEHRKARKRDGNTDSGFVTLVLEIEQDMLRRQAEKAKVIVSKEGKILSYDAYKNQINEEERHE